MLELAPARDADRVLDVATGTGAVLRELERSGVRPARIVGVDASEAMLRRARTRLARAELARADARALPFADGSFELVLCAYLLHLLDPGPRADVLAELRRVSAPDARLAVATVAPPSGSLRRLASAPVRALARRSGGVLAGLRPLDPAPELRAAGFAPRARRRVHALPPALVVLAAASPG